MSVGKGLCLIVAVGAFLTVTNRPVYASEVNVARFAGDYKKAIIESFEKKTDIQVNYYEVVYSAAEVGSPRAQKSSPEEDVAIVDATIARSANAEGLFQKIDRSAVPNIADLYKEVVVNGDYGPGTTFDYLGGVAPGFLDTR